MPASLTIFHSPACIPFVQYPAELVMSHNPLS